MLIAGGPGVGKSRLATDAGLAAATGRDARVHSIAGSASGRTIPLGALAQWAAAADVHATDITERVIETMTADAGGSPILLSIDDADLLDDASAYVVRQLLLHELVVLRVY